MALLLAATIGTQALWLLLAWLVGAAVSSYLSERKGYGDKAGLATGLVVSLAGIVIWLLMPPRANSDWKIKGPIGNQRKENK